MMSNHDLDDTIALLTRTLAALDALLRGLPEMWTQRNEGENTWTVFDVIGHLIHGERDAVGPWTQYLGVMQCDAHSG